jgi:phosphate transport system substrate-binding protein
VKHLTPIALAAMLALTAFPAGAAEITGAGSTFVYPVLAKWADAYKKETGVGLNYQSIGSGGGIQQITAKTVTFGASDMPLTPEDVAKNNFVQFPIINGAVVPILNLPGIKPGDITLDGPTIAKIFLGEIMKWNDPAIAKLNPGVKLPNTAIAVVHRSDGSGTTFIWTNYLSKISPEWKSKVGENTAVEWPVGIGAKGSEGVSNNVAQTLGSFGYVVIRLCQAEQFDLCQDGQSRRQGRRSNSRSFPICSGRSRLDQRAGFPRDHDRCCRRQILAGSRLHLHFDATGSG